MRVCMCLRVLLPVAYGGCSCLGRVNSSGALVTHRMERTWETSFGLHLTTRIETVYNLNSCLQCPPWINRHLVISSLLTSPLVIISLRIKMRTHANAHTANEPAGSTRTPPELQSPLVAPSGIRAASRRSATQKPPYPRLSTHLALARPIGPRDEQAPAQTSSSVLGNRSRQKTNSPPSACEAPKDRVDDH